MKVSEVKQMELKIYKCPKCGNMVEFIVKKACTPQCCGVAMEEVVANTTDAAQEKHVPVISCEGNLVTVRVGSVDHPMLPEHFIEWVVLVTKEGVFRKAMEPGSEPAVCFALTEGDAPVAAYAYCNLHGLWKAEV